MSNPNGREQSAGCVDVLTAAHNTEGTIARAVLSALGQREVRRVIVVDDGSYDETAARAEACDPNGKRVIVKRITSNVGPSKARNIALDLATASWVAILDGDDFFVPGRIGELLSKSEGFDFVADNLLQIPEGEGRWRASKPVLFEEDREQFILDLEAFVLGNVRPHGVVRTELGYLKPIMRRSFLGRNSLRYDETLRLGEDYVLYARALSAGARFLIIPEIAGYVATVRSGSLSARHSRQDLERLRDSDVDLLGDTQLSSSQRRAIKRHYASIDGRVQWINLIEALKSRGYLRSLRAFCRSPRVSIFLLRQLLEEILKRVHRPST
jgi:succinoglycan biosynthesis protein ExoU